MRKKGSIGRLVERTVLGGLGRNRGTSIANSSTRLRVVCQEDDAVGSDFDDNKFPEPDILRCNGTSLTCAYRARLSGLYTARARIMLVGKTPTL